MNAERERKGQSCTRQASRGAEIFLWDLVQIGFGFEAEVVSECVPSQTLFTDTSDTDTQRHTHPPSQNGTLTGLDSHV